MSPPSLHPSHPLLQEAGAYGWDTYSNICPILSGSKSASPTSLGLYGGAHSGMLRFGTMMLSAEKGVVAQASPKEAQRLESFGS